MAAPLASKPASPRRTASTPGYPALIALALSLPVAACEGSATGSPARPFSDASAIVDTRADTVDAAKSDRPDDVRIDGGASVDAEPETTLDAESPPMNSDPGGIFAYAFAPASDPSSDDVP
jgi:hypothetical protein